MRRYGWIAVLAVLLLVGATTYFEWRKSQETAAAQALGDSILAALNEEGSAARVTALNAIEAPEGSAAAVISLLAAGESYEDNPAEAAEKLLKLADDPSVPQAYRQIAVLKAVTIPEAGLSVDDRRARLENLIPGGGLARLLAQEQLAFLLIEEGQVDQAIAAFNEIGLDAEATPSLRQRTTQVIVALGSEPDFDPLGSPGAEGDAAESDGQAN